MRSRFLFSMRLTPRNRAVSAVVLLLFCLVFPVRLTSEETVLHRFKADTPQLQLEDTLYLSAGIELRQAGISSSRKEEDPDYILSAEYAVSGTQVKVEYTLSGAGAPDHILAGAAFTLSIDHNFDEQISAAVRRVFEVAGIQSAPSPEAEIEGLLPRQPEPQPPADPPAASPQEEPPLVLAPASLPPGIVSGGISGEADIREDRSSRTTATVRFNPSVSAAGFLLFGDATQFFHYGAAAVLSAGATWPGQSLSITLGTRLSLIRVFNDQGVAGGPLYLSTAGLDLQAGTGTGKSYRAGAGVSGGAALITVSGGGKMMTKTVPYMDFGVHTGIPIRRHLYLGGEVRFLLIFDQDLPIMGATPALTLNMEF